MIAINDKIPWLGRTDPDWFDVEPTEVPVDGIGFVQSHVSVEGLIKHAGGPVPGHDPHDEYPRVVEFEGRHWIVDGAHRSVVRIVRGERSILARVRRWPW